MKAVHCILLTISQLTTFGMWKRAESMSHYSGLSLVTTTTATDNGSPWIINSGLTASECGPG